MRRLDFVFGSMYNSVRKENNPLDESTGIRDRGWPMPFNDLRYIAPVDVKVHQPFETAEEKQLELLNAYAFSDRAFPTSAFCFQA